METGYKTTEQKVTRMLTLKNELEKKMPSVINAIGFGFYPANSLMLESMAQEYFQLEKELSLT